MKLTQKNEETIPNQCGRILRFYMKNMKKKMKKKEASFRAPKQQPC